MPAWDGAVEILLGRMACARFEDESVRCSDEHEALLDTRFIEVEVLKGHQLRDGGSTSSGESVAAVGAGVDVDEAGDEVDRASGLGFGFFECVPARGDEERAVRRVLVDRGESIAPLIASDPEPFATNPDPNAMSGAYGATPTGFVIEFPVVVLPPKPNS